MNWNKFDNWIYDLVFWPQTLLDSCTSFQDLKVIFWLLSHWKARNKIGIAQSIEGGCAVKWKVFHTGQQETWILIARQFINGGHQASPFSVLDLYILSWKIMGPHESYNSTEVVCFSASICTKDIIQRNYSTVEIKIRDFGSSDY